MPIIENKLPQNVHQIPPESLTPTPKTPSRLVIMLLALSTLAIGVFAAYIGIQIGKALVSQ
jgi:hypothetical protein